MAYDAGNLEFFLSRYPEYRDTAAVDELRARDFSRLGTGQTYLDYTGGGQYGDSQIRQHVRLLEENLLGNPHSAHEPSQAATRLLEEARSEVLRFFGASERDYTMVFTANATGALRLVGEAYSFGPDRSFLHLIDNHNSVNGIWEYAREKGAPLGLVMCEQATMRVDENDLYAKLSSMRPGLFAYPAQSNFSGVQHSLAYVKDAQELGWDVLLDAAAFVPNSPLKLDDIRPDFTALSFYKMFGYPTGTGGLIIRSDAAERLRTLRPSFSGGTVWAVTAQGRGHVIAKGSAAFEDGTVNYQNIPAVTTGLHYLRAVGMDTIHTRTRCLTGWTLECLMSMKHTNGSPLVEIYGPKSTENRGATIALNFLNSDGHIVDDRIVEREAARAGICVRTGCFCNPGAGEVAFGLREEQLSAITSGKEGIAALSLEVYLRRLGLQSAGAIRLSLGLPSNVADTEHFLAFAATFANKHHSTHGLPARTHC